MQHSGIIGLNQYAAKYNLNPGTVSKRLQKLYPNGVDVKGQGGLTQDNQDRLSKYFKVGAYSFLNTPQKPTENTPKQTITSGSLTVVEPLEITPTHIYTPDTLQLGFVGSGESYATLDFEALDNLTAVLEHNADLITRQTEEKAIKARLFKQKLAQIERAVSKLKDAKQKAEMMDQVQSIIAHEDNAKMQDLMNQLEGLQTTKKWGSDWF